MIYEQLTAHGEAEGEETRDKAIQMLEDGGFGPWSAAIGVLGTKAQLRLAKKEIRRAVSGFAKTIFLTDGLVAQAKTLLGNLSFMPAMRIQLMMLHAVEPVYGFTRGHATDKSLRAVYWAAGDF